MTIEYRFEKDPVPAFIGFEILDIDLRDSNEEIYRAEFDPSKYPFYSIYKDENFYLVKINIAGYKTEELDASISGDILSVKGVRTLSKIDMVSVFDGISEPDTFVRMFRLANNLTIDSVSYENGSMFIKLKINFLKARQGDYGSTFHSGDSPKVDAPIVIATPTPEPVVVPEAVVVPEPVAVVEPVVVPEPVPVVEPVVETPLVVVEPVPVVEPVVETPVVVPEPVVAPVVVDIPAPVAAPVEAPLAVVEPVPVVEPVVEAPKVEVVAEVAPVVVPEPVPVVEPAPVEAPKVVDATPDIVGPLTADVNAVAPEAPKIEVVAEVAPVANT